MNARLRCVAPPMRCMPVSRTINLIFRRSCCCGSTLMSARLSFPLRSCEKCATASLLTFCVFVSGKIFSPSCVRWGAPRISACRTDAILTLRGVRLRFIRVCFRVCSRMWALKRSVRKPTAKPRVVRANIWGHAVQNSLSSQVPGFSNRTLTGCSLPSLWRLPGCGHAQTPRLSRSGLKKWAGTC